jgi:hypothetical protein
LLSVSTNAPLKAPAAVGAKLMGNWQDAPAASVAGAEELTLRTGQAEDPLLFRVKFAAMLGLLPVDGIGKVNVAFPMFSTVTVCGLSVLVEPTAVLAKVRLGGSARSSFATRPLPASATRTFPPPSTARPVG